MRNSNSLNIIARVFEKCSNTTKSRMPEWAVSDLQRQVAFIVVLMMGTCEIYDKSGLRDVSHSFIERLLMC